MHKAPHQTEGITFKKADHIPGRIFQSELDRGDRELSDLPKPRPGFVPQISQCQTSCQQAHKPSKATSASLKSHEARQV